MRASIFNLVAFLASVALLGAALSTDVCGEIDSVLKLRSSAPPHRDINYGRISECMCISHISSYVGSTPMTSAAVANAGRSAVVNAITEMVNACEKRTCRYPAHAIASCQRGNPCSFTCKDGFTPFPFGSHPTSCACNKPYKVCNGKCGSFKACPSGRPVNKRDLPGGINECSEGLTSCPVPGRGSHSMECINTRTDLESCGGCVLPSFPEDVPEGVDCTAIQGISDVSCMFGRCVVHRCMLGHVPSKFHDSCVPRDESSEIVFAVPDY